jgi:hypothetical protein
MVSLQLVSQLQCFPTAIKFPFQSSQERLLIHGQPYLVCDSIQMNMSLVTLSGNFMPAKGSTVWYDIVPSEITLFRICLIGTNVESLEQSLMRTVPRSYSDDNIQRLSFIAPHPRKQCSSQSRPIPCVLYRVRVCHP